MSYIKHVDIDVFMTTTSGAYAQVAELAGPIHIVASPWDSVNLGGLAQRRFLLRKAIDIIAIALRGDEETVMSLTNTLKDNLSFLNISEDEEG